MVDWNIIASVSFLSVILGAILGRIWFKVQTRRLQRNAQKEIEKQNLLFSEAGEETKQGLNAFRSDGEKEGEILIPCLICGKKTKTNTCSVEHYKEAMRNYQTLQSEGNHEPKREGEVISEVKSSAPSHNTNPFEETSKVQADTIKKLMKENEKLKTKKK